MLVTRSGMGIRFGQEDLRPMGLVAAGVNGIKFKGDDIVVGASVVDETDSCCFVLNDWSLGQIAAADFPKQGRYGQGVIALRLETGQGVTLVWDCAGQTLCLSAADADSAMQIAQSVKKISGE
jgi:DNA gyrase subunit A